MASILYVGMDVHTLCTYSEERWGRSFSFPFEEMWDGSESPFGAAANGFPPSGCCIESESGRQNDRRGVSFI